MFLLLYFFPPRLVKKIIFFSRSVKELCAFSDSSFALYGKLPKEERCLLKVLLT